MKKKHFVSTNIAQNKSLVINNRKDKRGMEDIQQKRCVYFLPEGQKINFKQKIHVLKKIK